MEGQQALVVDIINKLNFTANAKQKVQQIEQLEELLLRSQPLLLDGFLPELIPLQASKAVTVRRKLLGFVAAAVRVRPSPAVLSTAAPCVTMLLSDEQAQLAREAAQAAHVLLSRGLFMLGSMPQVDAAAGAAWALVQGLQRDLSNFAIHLCGSHGGSSSRQLAMCLAGIKMCEQAVLHYTSEVALRLPPAISNSLQAETSRLLQTVLQLLAVASVKQRAGPVVIAAVKALGLCCLQRPVLLTLLLPSLLALAQQGVFKLPQPGDGQSGVEASCGAALKDVLIRAFRHSNSELFKPWRQQLLQALEALGASAAAASVNRHLDRQAARAKEGAGSKRKAGDQAGRDPKQQRPGTPAAAESSYGNTPTRTPTPQPTPMGPSGGGVDMPPDLMSLFRPGPGVNMVEALNNAQQVLEVLVKAEQTAAVEAILSTVSADVLAELVARWMDNLPQQPFGAPAAAAPPAVQPPPPQQQQQPAAAKPAARAPSPMQFDAAGLSQFLAAQQQQQQPAGQQAAPVVKQQQQALDPRQRPAAPPAPAAKPSAAPAAQAPAAAAATAAPPAPAAAPRAATPPAKPLPTPLPRALNADQVAAMRTAAVRRILGATGNKPIRNFRELLLSRLASRAPEGQGLSHLMLQHVIADYHKNRGHVLLVRWLYALAAAVATSSSRHQQQQGDPAGGSGGSGVGDGDGDVTMAEADAAGPPAAAEAEAAAEVEAAAAAAAAAAGAAAGVGAGAAAPAPCRDGDAVMLDAFADKSPDKLARAAAEAAAAVAAQEQGEAQQHGSSSSIHHHLQQPKQHEEEDTHHQQQQQPKQHGDPQQANSRSSGGGGGHHPKGSSSSSSAPDDLSGTQYESVLMASLQGLKQHLPSSDPAILQLLQEAPVLPLHAVTAFLQELLSYKATEGAQKATEGAQKAPEGADWPGMALTAAYGLFESRPATRERLLGLILGAAVAAEGPSRERAVGLVVSKIINWQDHAATVLEFATEHLQMLLQQQQQPSEAGAVEKQQQQQEGEQPKAVNGDQQQQAAEGGDAAAAAAEQQQQVAMGVETAAQHSMLYLSLCTVKPEMLQLLLETYGKAGTEARAALVRYAPSLALAIGPAAPQLLQLIQHPPEGSHELLLAMITALAESQPPPQPLVQACLTHYQATGSVQLLDPVTHSLSKDQVVSFLPKLLMQLPDQRLRLLYRRLALSSHGREPLFAPVELLVLLHKITSEPDMPQATFKANGTQIMSAIDRAMRTPEVFPAAVMQTAISRMEAMNPPPRLFMRSVNIMVTHAAVPLIKWVITLLERLIQKQVWVNGNQWRGFLTCCEKLADNGSAYVLLQLPESILEKAMGSFSEAGGRSLWKKVHDAAHAEKCPVPVYKGTRQVVDKFYERWLKAEVEQKQSELAASKQAAAAAAAAAGAGAKAPRGLATGGAAAQPAAAAGSKPKAHAGSASAAPPAAAAAGATAAAAGAQSHQGGQQQQQQQQQEGHAVPAQQADILQQEASAAAAAAQAAAAATNDGQEEDDFVLDFDDEDD